MTDTFSKRLQGVASDIRLLPDEEELNNSYMRMIVSNLAHVETKPISFRRFGVPLKRCQSETMFPTTG